MTEVFVPKMGMSTIEVEILEVLVSVGDTVDAETTVAVIGGDKAEVEIPAGVSGVVSEVLVKAGDESEVGRVIARIQ
jgi:pyruvate/2-oxoglutarate dehydrogenase complex dihydrolipoamide acyltransferase (E2) component